MLKFVEGSDLAKQFLDLQKNSSNVDIAVAFWGKGAVEELRIEGGKPTRVICNLDSGACHPDEIEKLRNLLGPNIKNCGSLHAKVYLTDNAVIVGSSNASSNGLAIAGAISSGWLEANIVLNQPDLLNDLRSWFDKTWSRATSISAADIKIARLKWDNRSKSTGGKPLKKGKIGLLEVLKERPDILETTKIYCVAYNDDLGEGARKMRDEAKKDKKKLPELKDFGKPWLSQPVKPYEKNSWLIRCNFEKKSGGQIDGYAYVDAILYYRGIDNPDPYLAHSAAGIKIQGRLFKLTAEEEKILLFKLRNRKDVKDAWKHGDAVILLQRLLSDSETRTSSNTPNTRPDSNNRRL